MTAFTVFDGTSLQGFLDAHAIFVFHDLGKGTTGDASLVTPIEQSLL